MLRLLARVALSLALACGPVLAQDVGSAGAGNGGSSSWVLSDGTNQASVDLDFQHGLYWLDGYVERIALWPTLRISNASMQSVTR